MIPNNTHASLIESYGQEVFPKILADGEFLEPEYGNRIVFDSLLTLEGISGPLKVCRSFYPCHEATAVVQKVRLTNLSKAAGSGRNRAISGRKVSPGCSWNLYSDSRSGYFRRICTVTRRWDFVLCSVFRKKAFGAAGASFSEIRRKRNVCHSGKIFRRISVYAHRMHC